MSETKKVLFVRSDKRPTKAGAAIDLDRLRDALRGKRASGGHRATPQRGHQRLKSNHEKASIPKLGSKLRRCPDPSSPFQPCRPVR